MRSAGQRNLRSPHQRQGAAIVFAMMALLIASLLIGTLIRTVAFSHRELRRDEIRTQANLIADAGCRRAVISFQENSDLIEETWNIPAAQLDSGYAATVYMKVTAKDTKPDQRVVSLTVRYPLEHPDLVQVTREFVFP